MPVEYVEDLYLASPELLLARISGADDSHRSLLIVGHNPGLQQLALTLGGAGPLHDRIRDKYPTGALAEIVLPVERWSEVGEDQGEVARFIRPRDLKGGSEADED